MDFLQACQNRGVPAEWINGIRPYANAVDKFANSTAEKISQFVEDNFTVIFFTFASIISIAFVPTITLLGAAVAFSINHFVCETKSYPNKEVFTKLNATALGVSAMVGLLSASYGGFIFNAIPLIGGIGLGNTAHRAFTKLF